MSDGQRACDELAQLTEQTETRGRLKNRAAKLAGQMLFAATVYLQFPTVMRATFLNISFIGQSAQHAT